MLKWRNLENNAKEDDEMKSIKCGIFLSVKNIYPYANVWLLLMNFVWMHKNIAPSKLELKLKKNISRKVMLLETMMSDFIVK